MNDILSLTELQQLIASPMLAEEASVVTGEPCLIVDLKSVDCSDQVKGGTVLWPACPVIGLSHDGFESTNESTSLIDVLVENEDDLALLLQCISSQPVAAATLVQVLRHNARADIEQGLLAESLAYSSLQQSAGFKAWRDQEPHENSHETSEHPLLIEREENELVLMLNRPLKHNAFNEALKDALCNALHLAIADPLVEKVTLRGLGPSFCAGGDLSEFGAVTDAGIAHISRTTRSAGRLLAILAEQSAPYIHTRVQGACIGAGIELPAFTQHIAASPNAFFQLPELGMGLIPGAGGTVSILRRIGRWKTAYMAISDSRVDAQTALSWGLIDELLPT